MIQDLACCSYLIHIVHEHFCCNRGFAALIREEAILTRPKKRAYSGGRELMANGV